MKALLGGAEVAYEEKGEGPAVLLLHAFPLGLEMWDAQVEALAGPRRVVRFDARGFGESPPGAGPLTMDAIADDAAALLDLLGIEKAVVCGCSMGGYAALAFVRRHARRLAALVLQDTKATPDTDEARAGRAALAQRVLAEGPAAVLEALLPRLLGETSRRERPEVVAFVSRLALAAAPAGIAHALAGLAARADSRPTLDAIRVPLLVVVGEEDVLTPPSDAEAIAAAVPGARLVRVPRAGHLANLEQPALVNAALGTFLAGLRP